MGALVSVAANDPMKFDADDYLHMAHALRLARRGMYSTRPNPRVGCVLVKEGAVIGEGFHYRAGDAHAEVAALTAAGPAAAGATAYVTLEPCSHFGRTPPCTDALIAAGVARVVYAVDDPNPRVAGGGAARLEAGGISCTGGLLAEEARALNRGFFMRHTHARPFVTVKLGMSLDGKVALADGQSQWITGPEARADVQRLRAETGAIMTGSGTILADDPRLTVRDPRFDLGGRPPSRVVLDTQLRLSAVARVFDEPGEVRVFTAAALTGTQADTLRTRGAILEAAPMQAGRLDLAAVLHRLADLEVNEILVEAGPTLVAALMAAQLVDELVLYVAPLLLGAAARNAFAWPQLEQLAKAPRVIEREVVTVGADRRIVLGFNAP